MENEKSFLTSRFLIYWQTLDMVNGHGGYIYEPILRISYEKDTVKKLCNYWVEILNIDNFQKIMI